MGLRKGNEIIKDENIQYIENGLIYKKKKMILIFNF
jgi:hypothetical protein